jgi:hypothetical protein
MFKLPAKTREILELRVKLGKQRDETTRQNSVIRFWLKSVVREKTYYKKQKKRLA